MYTLNLTRHDMDSLGWLADRYTAAQVLYDALQLAIDVEPGDEPADREIPYTIEEHQAWAFNEALEQEDPAGVIPCLDYSSHLGAEILRLEQEIV